MLFRSARLSRESNSVLGGFIDGQFRVMLCLGALYAGGLWLIGIDSALLIGFLSGALNFVPYMGFVVGIVLAAIASIIQFGDVQHLIWVGVVYGIGQFTESFILTPRIVGDRIGLNPVMVIFVLMAGGLLFGFLGILLAYGFVGPLASLLEQKLEESTKMFQCVKVTLLASLNGYAPALAVEFGRKVLYSTERPTFSELEDHIKKSKTK